MSICYGFPSKLIKVTLGLWPQVVGGGLCFAAGGPAQLFAQSEPASLWLLSAWLFGRGLLFSRAHLRSWAPRAPWRCPRDCMVGSARQSLRARVLQIPHLPQPRQLRLTQIIFRGFNLRFCLEEGTLPLKKENTGKGNLYMLRSLSPFSPTATPCPAILGPFPGSCL